MKVSVQYYYFYAPGGVRPQVEVEDSRQWPLKRHARVELEGAELWSRFGQPTVVASAIAKVEGAATIVDTGSVRGISSVVVVLQGSESVLEISELQGQAQSDSRIVGSEIAAVLGLLKSESLTVVELSGISVEVRSGYIAGLVGPDLEVVEDEELLFLLEVA